MKIDRASWHYRFLAWAFPSDNGILRKEPKRRISYCAKVVWAIPLSFLLVIFGVIIFLIINLVSIGRVLWGNYPTKLDWLVLPQVGLNDENSLDEACLKSRAPWFKIFGIRVYPYQIVTIVMAVLFALAYNKPHKPDFLYGLFIFVEAWWVMYLIIAGLLFLWAKLPKRDLDKDSPSFLSAWYRRISPTIEYVESR